MDIGLDNSGDIDLSTGDLTLLDGIQEARQRVEIKLRLFKGEWFLAPSFGLPWFRDALIKNPSLDVIRAMIVKAVETEPGIDKVTEIVLNFASDARRLSIESLKTLVSGEPVDFASFDIVEL